MHNTLFALNLNEYRAPRVLYRRYTRTLVTGVTEFPSKGMKFLHNFFRSSEYGYGCLTELTRVPGIVAQGYRTYRGPGGDKTCYTRTDSQ